MAPPRLEESLLAFLQQHSFACQSEGEWTRHLERCIEKLPEGEPFGGDLFEGPECKMRKPFSGPATHY